MTVWARLHREDDEWAEFPGMMLAVMLLVMGPALIGVGYFGLGAHDEVTQEAIRNVGGIAGSTCVLLGLVMCFGILGRWSPSGWFYLGVLAQGLYIIKFFFGVGVASERVGIATVLASGVFFALDGRASAAARCPSCHYSATGTDDPSHPRGKD